MINENLRLAVIKSNISRTKYKKLWECTTCGKKFKRSRNRSKNKYCSRKCFGKSIKGNSNNNWKGDQKITLPMLHRWVIRNINKEKICEKCKSKENIDLANKTGIYNRDFSNWNYLCRKCHMVEDGRLEKLKTYKNMLITC